MKHLLRLYRSCSYRSFGFAALLVMGALMALPGASAQATKITQILKGPSPLLLLSSSQGYLGVDLTDVDQEKAQSLKLKEVRGAVITLIDHDAPAGQIGLKVNDVVLRLNGQAVEGAEQLRRMLREIPAGRTVSLEISRDGNIQTLAVQLADRRVMERDVWNKIGNSGDVFTQPPPGMGILGDNGPVPGGFHMPFFGSTLNVGAMVEPLTSQMAEVLGVPSGVMVKQVARKSEAAAAGLQAFDVILKVGNEAIRNLAGWDRALRANQGKPVQVTILRDKKQQTLTLQVDSKHHQGELEMEDFFPAEDWPLVAEIDPELAQELAGDAEGAAEAMRDQAKALKDELQAGEMEHFALSPEEVEALEKQAEKLRESLKPEEYKIDQQQLEQLKQQMDELRKSIHPEDFRIDPKQMEELKALRFGNYV
jgi:membrane-associated protease RseP (regulator of RpoE activity)